MRMKPEQWQEVIDVNLSGVFYCTQARLVGELDCVGASFIALLTHSTARTRELRLGLASIGGINSRKYICACLGARAKRHAWVKVPRWAQVACAR